MRKAMIGLLLVGLLVIGCRSNKEIEIKENYTIDNTLFLHIESTGDNGKDFEKALDYIEDNKIKSNDIVIRIYKNNSFEAQREYELKNDQLEEINSMEDK